MLVHINKSTQWKNMELIICGMLTTKLNKIIIFAKLWGCFLLPKKYQYNFSYFFFFQLRQFIPKKKKKFIRQFIQLENTKLMSSLNQYHLNFLFKIFPQYQLMLVQFTVCLMRILYSISVHISCSFFFLLLDNSQNQKTQS